MSRKRVCSLLSCVRRAAAGSKDFLLCFLLLFSNAYNKNIALFLRKSVYIVTWFPGGFWYQRLFFFGESCERTGDRNSRNFELLQGEMVHSLSKSSGSPRILVNLWYRFNMDICIIEAFNKDLDCSMKIVVFVSFPEIWLWLYNMIISHKGM